MATVLVSDLKRLAAMASSLQSGDAEFILCTTESQWGAVIPGLGNTSLAHVKFSVEGDGLPCDVGLNAGRFATMVKSLTATRVEVTLEGNMLTATSGGRKRAMAIYDASSMTAPKIPNLSPPCEATLPCDDFLAAVTAANACANIIRLGITPDGVTVESYAAEGEPMLSTSHDTIPCAASGESTALYATDLLLLILRPYKGRDVTIRNGSDYPINIECDDDVCLIAPRTEVK